MGTNDIKSLIEAALFASGRSLTLEEIANLCKSGNIGFIRRTIEELIREYSERRSGLEICESANGYSMRIKREFEQDVIQLIPETEIEPAVLKTLALIAYEEPIKQSKVVEERGNRAYRYIKKLREQELINAEKCGRTRLLRTTPKFREYFQIVNLKEAVKGDKI